MFPMWPSYVFVFVCMCVFVIAFLDWGVVFSCVGICTASRVFSIVLWIAFQFALCIGIPCVALTCPNPCSSRFAPASATVHLYLMPPMRLAFTLPCILVCGMCLCIFAFARAFGIEMACNNGSATCNEKAQTRRTTQGNQCEVKMRQHCKMPNGDADYGRQYQMREKLKAKNAAWQWQCRQKTTASAKRKNK